jgi:hypothetical protein
MLAHGDGTELGRAIANDCGLRHTRQSSCTIGRVNAAAAVSARAAELLRSTESAQLGSAAYATFRRSDFRWSWMATRLHTFVFVIELPPSSKDEVVAVAELSRAWARKHKGGLPRGMQSGSAAMPLIITPDISSELWEWAASPQPVRFAAALFPVVVSSDGEFASYRRSSAKLGIVYESFLRQLASGLLSATGAA